ncbi:unnamed protein product, partial [Urochloa humidicola]
WSPPCSFSRTLRPSATLPRASRRPTRVAVVAAAAPELRLSTTNYGVPLDAAPFGITRPLAEILRNLSKRFPEIIV